MGLRGLHPLAYGKLLAAELPQPIQNEREFKRAVAASSTMNTANTPATRVRLRRVNLYN